jgi:hypothetical protein
VDPDLIDQALINLVRNSIDALRDTPAGRITPSARRDLQNPVVISIETMAWVPRRISLKGFFLCRSIRPSGTGAVSVRYLRRPEAGEAPPKLCPSMVSLATSARANRSTNKTPIIRATPITPRNLGDCMCAVACMRTSCALDEAIPAPMLALCLESQISSMG